MKIQTMPKETLAELLLFLSDNEEFASVQELLIGGMTIQQVRSALRELALELKREAAQETETNYNPQKDSRLAKETKTIISYLSSGEEKTLLQAFGLVDKVKSALNTKAPRRQQ